MHKTQPAHPMPVQICLRKDLPATTIALWLRSATTVPLAGVRASHRTLDLLTIASDCGCFHQQSSGTPLQHSRGAMTTRRQTDNDVSDQKQVVGD